MEPILIAVAFGCGMVVNLIGLPPCSAFWPPVLSSTAWDMKIPPP